MADHGTPAPGNRLAGESSPYLRQHATNPVDWFPWGEEAFRAARERDRPILLSVGYSACHWCHVMAHESFEHAETARMMNAHFVNVKVDREERPDVDAVYMTATQAMTGHGGWPMTVFMTPDGKPFYCGTYFPPHPTAWDADTATAELSGFPRLLHAIRDAWTDDRDQLLASAEHVTRQLQEAAAHRPTEAAPPVSAALAREAVEHFAERYDRTNGGFGGAPKFPSPGNLEFLLMHHARAAHDADPAERDAAERALEMVRGTLDAMAQGGIYDHLGGGFHRYAVDSVWVVPHFEKMLYDNAQLARTYLHAWQVTGEDRYRRVTTETLDYLLREMREPGGGCYAAQDADSEGVEGKFFVWTPAEVRAALAEDDPLSGDPASDGPVEDGPTFGADDVTLCIDLFDVTEAGNFRDPHQPQRGSRTVLTRTRPLDELARARDTSAAEIAERAERLRARLFRVRARRAPPGLDDKILTDWNGLALAAFAEAGRVLGERRYLDAAEANARFVRDTMWRDGVLLHSYSAQDGRAKVPGLLDDYAGYGLGLVELYRATGDPAHLHWAAELWEALLARFHDPDGGFFDTANDGEALIFRQRPLFDAPTPSGNAAAALLGLWLGRTLDRPEWERHADEVLTLAGERLASGASGFGALWQLAELRLAPRREIAIVGPPEARAPLEAVVARHFLPTTVLAPAAEEALPLHRDRLPPNGAAAYVCEGMTCDLPAHDPAALAAQLAAAYAPAAGG